MKEKFSIILEILLGLVILMPTTKVAADQTQTQPIKTNKHKLLTLAVQGEIAPAQPDSSYSVTWDGKPKTMIGIGGINYNLQIGDKVFGWASADRATVGVATVGAGSQRAKSSYLNFTSIGNQVKARGVGLQIEGFEEVRVNKLSPSLLENMGIKIKGDQLVIPVVMEIPGHIMGSGIGFPFIESLDYDIQTTCPKTVEEYELKKLKLGDVVAIRDHYDFYGTGRYEGALTIGICIHGFSESSGHGPGLNPVLSALPGRIKTVIDPHANTAYYLGIKEKPKN